MKVNVISRKLIKPCNPTPSHLRIHKLSQLEELNSPMHLIRIFYYPSGENMSLEEPLAQVLPLFYPLAGRYNREKKHIECNDEGAEYCVAEVDCRLDQVLMERYSAHELNHLLPVDIRAADGPTDPILAIQINRFECGGVAIGICTSHRIFDSCAQAAFLKAWAAAAAGSDVVMIRPILFDSSSYFPSDNLPDTLQFPVSRTRDTSIVTKKFSFDTNAISRLRERLMISGDWKSRSNSERPPSRFTVVSTLLTQALLRADRAKNGKSRAALVVQAIDLRGRTVPPVPKHTCGSLVFYSYLELTADHDEENDFTGTALKLREAVIKGIDDCARVLSDRQFGRRVLVDSYADAARKNKDPNYKVMRITDWTKFGEYEVDFGFGKPIWVSLADVPLKDLFILMNNKDNDGIEAWAYLDESDMPFFQQDEDLMRECLPTTN